MQCVNRITALLFGGLLLCVLIYLPMLTEAQQSTDKDWPAWIINENSTT